MEPERLASTDLHVHTSGCYTPEDLFNMVKDCYREVNWNRFSFLDRYETVFGTCLDPVGMFDRAHANHSLDEISQVATYRWHPEGSFEEFDVKSFFALAVAGYHLDRDQHEPVLAPILERHRSEGLGYVEYRNAFSTSGQEFRDWHGRYASFLQEASDERFTARYIIRLDGRDPIGSYLEVRALLDENPDVLDTVVGVDFSGREIPPRNLESFYRHLAEDNSRCPDSLLDAVVHIGENFFDLSLESAIRWCHESALFGARRLAHCIALGMAPQVSLDRRRGAHRTESVRERIDQIQYDLLHAPALSRHGVLVNERGMETELRELLSRDPMDLVDRPYDKNRLAEISARQDYVLSDLCRLGTVIETCPTSNLCIGGVPGVTEHPFPKLYRSGVNLAICTDDPGIFGVTLSQELENISRWFGISREEMAVRLGDPFRFRLASKRTNGRQSLS